MKRKVFGRRDVELEGKVWRFELRSDGVWCWPLRRRRRQQLTFLDLAHASEGQALFNWMVTPRAGARREVKV